MIGVQYEDRKSRCKVIWVMDGGPLQKIQVGVQIVTDQDCPWKGELPPDQIATRPSPTIAGVLRATAFPFLWSCATSA